MMKINRLLFIFCLVFCGCINDELPGSEADIVSFNIPEVELIDKSIDVNSVYIMVENGDVLRNVRPKIEVSQGAHILPDTFVNLHDVEYVVTSENGHSQKRYTIDIAKEYIDDVIYFPFEEWSVTGDGYDKFKDARWSSGNGGITMALGILGRSKIPENYPSQMTDAGKSGNAVQLKTKKGGDIFGMKIAVWAGNFFLGNFNTSKVVTPLYATEFGRVYKRKPLRLHGFYKYTEGAGLYHHSYSDGVIDSFARPDTCAIYAIFYRADNQETLTAYDINSSPLIIARADLLNGAATSGTDFHEFDIPFNYKSEPDFEHHTYKLAIVFSSSAAGGTPKYENGVPTSTVIYAGKPGSTLIVDEVMVVNE
ncbi:hypothetical protein FACS189467_1070 [Bacteroidia bacterium]|nr:hypothetical protein FACS189467_1070 [Bacteroidia bacterium]